MNHKKEIAQRIIEIIEATQLSHREFSALCQISPQTPYHWELGRQYPNANSLLKLAQHLNINPNYVLCLSDELLLP